MQHDDRLVTAEERRLLGTAQPHIATMMGLNRGAVAPALAAVAAPLPLLLLALLLPLASAQFTQITSTFLAGTCNVDDGFGAEDKMAICNGDLVFIDLDPDVPPNSAAKE